MAPSGNGGPPPAIVFVPTLHNDTYPAITPTQFDMTGRYVLITGASRGVGKAMAISYAKANASGIALLARTDLSSVKQEILDISASQNQKNPSFTPPQILTIKADITNQSDVEAAANEIKSAFNNKIDIVINNAGYLEKFTPIADSNPDEWWRTWEINIKGTYLITRSFIPLLLNSDLKTLVQVSSFGAIVSWPGASAYQATKTAMLRLNDFIQVEYEPKGLLVYGIHPGGVKTELAKGMPVEMHGILNDEPELCGDCVVWLTHSRKEWLAGRFFSVQWDVNEVEAKKDEIVEKDLLKIRMRA